MMKKWFSGKKKRSKSKIQRNPNNGLPDAVSGTALGPSHASCNENGREECNQQPPQAQGAVEGYTEGQGQGGASSQGPSVDIEDQEHEYQSLQAQGAEGLGEGYTEGQGQGGASSEGAGVDREDQEQPLQAQGAEGLGEGYTEGQGQDGASSEGPVVDREDQEQPLQAQGAEGLGEGYTEGQGQDGASSEGPVVDREDQEQPLQAQGAEGLGEGYTEGQGQGGASSEGPGVDREDQEQSLQAQGAVGLGEGYTEGQGQGGASSEGPGVDREDQEQPLQAQGAEGEGEGPGVDREQHPDRAGVTYQFQQLAVNGSSSHREQSIGNEHSNEGHASQHQVREQVQCRQQVHTQEEAAESPQELLVSSEMMRNTCLIDHVALLLDRPHRLLEYWEHFACAVNAPLAVRAKCKINTKHSPTVNLFESLENLQETVDLKVYELNSMLGELRRNDVVKIIKDRVPASRLSNKVSEEITNNSELLEEIANKLDQQVKVLKNWFHLGLKVGIKKATLDDMKIGNSPSFVLLEYAYTVLKDLTVENFREKALAIKRNDLVGKLSDIPAADRSKLMKEVVPLESDKMREICSCLNKNAGGVLHDWKHLAYEMGIDRALYMNFDPKDLQSPTRLLLEWLCSDQQNFTVQSLCRVLKKMKRYDVVEVIEKEFNQSFS